MNNILLIDFNNCIIRSLKATPYLTYQGIPTGGIFGLYKQLISILKQKKFDRIVAVTDSPPYDRKKLFPQLKCNRPSKELSSEEQKTFFEALNFTKAESLKLLNCLGIELLGMPGAEADDLIAEIIKTLIQENYNYEKDYSFVVLSNDSDLFTLFSDTRNLEFYRKNCITDKMEFFKIEDFVEKYNISPDDYLDYIAMVGSHNSFPGIKGIGPKTAVKYLNALQILDYKNIEKFDKIFQENEAHFELAEKVLKLPFRNYLDNYKKSEWLFQNFLKKPKVNYYALLKLLTSLGIQITQADEQVLNKL